MDKKEASESLVTITKITENVTMVVGKFPFKPDFLQFFLLCDCGHHGMNVYIIGSGKKRIIIDTGMPGQEAFKNAIIGIIEKEDLEIEKILITHHHMDHIGGLTFLLPYLKSKGQDPKVYKRESDYPPDLDFISKNNVTINNLNDDDVIEVEGARIRVILTPGHCKDHSCFFMENDKILFTGDHIMGGKTTFIEDMDTYVKSLEKTKDLVKNEGVKILLPGHNFPSYDPLAKIAEHLDHREDVEVKIIDIIKASSNSISFNDLLIKVEPVICSNDANPMKESIKRIVTARLDIMTKSGKIEQTTKSEEGKDIQYIRSL